MNLSVTDRFTIREASELYGLAGWGNGYFRISADGCLTVTPERGAGPAIDIYQAIRRLSEQGIQTPVLLRFPELLGAQVQTLCGAFDSAIKEYEYQQRFQPLYPLKVNQQRSVVDSLIDSGRSFGMGLEVGSRPELMVALALDTPPDSLLVCNGFKDAEYLASAELASRLGKRVVVVVEKPLELEAIRRQFAGSAKGPMIGLRIRLQARGSGLWEKSGGFASKFGLTTHQLLTSLETLREAGLDERLALLHFHIGSQITDIRKVKAAIREAARVYAKLRKLGVAIRYVDVGGGLGIDYDGSRTSSDASVNYSVQEYANDVVFGISEVCDEEQVPHPAILCESGRMLTAYHSVLVTDVRGAISGVVGDLAPPAPTDAQVVSDLAEVLGTMTVKNYREFYHDALEYRDQMQSLFNLGMLGLEERARGESLFWKIAERALRFARTRKFMAEEFIQLESKLHDKYICNFSVFQSLPDHWALDQLFPIMPIHRLNQPPDQQVALVDITCDSDGEVGKFVDLKDIKETLDLHPLIPGQPYYLAFLLVGAYQDTMGDLHNLFGRVHEVEVVRRGDGDFDLRNLREGESAAETLDCFGFPIDGLVETIEAGLSRATEAGELSPEEATSLLEAYRSHLRQYTYLR